MKEKEPKYEARIRYVEDWYGQGEHFVFEGKWTNEEEWGLDTAFKLLDYRDENWNVHEKDKAAVLSYQALTKIRELQKMKIPFYFC